jgi:hypothetical protein
MAFDGTMISPNRAHSMMLKSITIASTFRYGSMSDNTNRKSKKRQNYAKNRNCEVERFENGQSFVIAW